MRPVYGVPETSRKPGITLHRTGALHRRFPHRDGSTFTGEEVDTVMTAAVYCS
jgi:hypothetical protein